MLSKNQVAVIRNAIESTYDSSCDIIEYQPFTKANGATNYREVIVLKDQPCKVSFKTVTSIDNNNNVPSIYQSIKLFISPDIVIKPGSRIEIESRGQTVAYKNSGQPAVYDTHQEVVLDLFKRWA